MALMEQVKHCAPDGLLNAEVLLRDQFVEHVSDGALRWELNQFVRRQPTATVLEVHGGLQYGVQSHSRPPPLATSQSSELGELKELLRHQQQQLDQLTRTVASLQDLPVHSRPTRSGPLMS